MKAEPRQKKFPAARWIKRFGAAGFLFFLVKGLLLYIIIPAVVGYFALK